MAEPSKTLGSICFGRFELSVETGELRKDGVRLKLAGQAIQVLAMLAANPGKLVTREELQQKLWPGASYGDPEHGLNAAVNRLREVLGDSATDPKYIETLAKRGYRFVAPVDAVTAAPLSDDERTPIIHSLAVLPMQNLSGDPAQEYFADGMTEELITELSSISSLKVISRTSVMRYKKSDKSLPEIAGELNVDAIVEGSVARSGNDVRITAQLVYAPQDKNVWARSYQSRVENSLTMQSQIASAITEAVRAQIAPGEQEHLRTARPANLKALEAYLQGNYHFNRYGGGSGLEETEKALEYFRQAIAEDPSFARAYEAMARVYRERRILLPQAQTVPLMRAAAEKALALDPNLATAHLALGSAKLGYDWDWQGAEREYRRAIELDPNNAWARESLGWFLISMGRMEDGLNEQQEAQELDPFNDHIGYGLYLARQYDRAINPLIKFLEVAPGDGRAHFWLSENYAQKGMYKEAIQHLQLTAALFGLKEIAESMNRGYVASGYQGAMRELAKGTEQLAIHEKMPPGYVAKFYLRSGDKEQALKWLQKDYEERADNLLTMLQVDPVWDPLRSDPRFKDLVRRVGLPQ